MAREVRINHLQPQYSGGVFTYGSSYVDGWKDPRSGGAFRHPTHGTAVCGSTRIRCSSYRKAQRVLLQYLKGYKVC